MVSTRLLISESSGLLTKPFGIVPIVQITIGITVTIVFHIIIIIIISVEEIGK